MKKTEKKQRLPKFKATTLRLDDLKQVTGGMMSGGLMRSGSAGCTAGTRSVCHIDGTDDAN